MFRIQTELPCGAVSIGTIRKDEDGAKKVFDSYIRQIKAMTGLVADVILSDDGVEVQREHIRAN
jgi:hypothetical protein